MAPTPQEQAESPELLRRTRPQNISRAVKDLGEDQPDQHQPEEVPTIVEPRLQQRYQPPHSAHLDHFPQGHRQQLAQGHPKRPAPVSTSYDGSTKWFDDPAHFQQMMSEVASICLDKTFSEELNAVEHWFNILTEMEQTAAVYALLRYAKQMQLRFFSAVLEQKARSDPVLSAELAEKEQRSQRSQVHHLLANLSLHGRGESASKAPLQGAPRGPVMHAPAMEQERNDRSAALSGFSWDFAGTGATISSSGMPNSAGAILGGTPSGQPYSLTLDAGQLPVGASPPGLTIQRPRSAMGFHVTSGSRSGWSGATQSATVATFTESAGQYIGRPKSASPMANSMGDGGMDINQLSLGPSVSEGTGRVRAFADSIRNRPAPLSLPHDTAYHPSGIKSAMLPSYTTSIFDQDPSTFKPSGPASRVGGGLTDASKKPVSQGGSRSASPMVRPGLFVNAQGGVSSINSTGHLSSPTAATSTQPTSVKSRTGSQLVSPLYSDAAKSSGPISPTKSAHSAHSVHKRGTEQDAFDVQLFKTDIPGWLRSQRLHKYTPNFAGKPWQEIVQFNDNDLQKLGVAALGARNKLLRLFEGLRDALGVSERKA